MLSEGGQATVEWTGLLLLVCLIAGGAVAVAPAVDGRSFGGFLAHRFVCSVRGHCRDGQVALARAYGAADAALVREHAPGLVYEPGERQLPVDYLRCRRRACAEAPDDRDLDAHHSRTGERATVFTRVLRRGGSTYVQYWLYFPDSNSTWAGSDEIWERNRLLPLIGRVLGGTRRVPGLPPGRLGGRPGPDRPGRARMGARQLARPLPGLQAGDLPQPAGSERAAGRASRAGAMRATSPVGCGRRTLRTCASGRRCPAWICASAPPPLRACA